MEKKRPISRMTGVAKLAFLSMFIAGVHSANAVEAETEDTQIAEDTQIIVTGNRAIQAELTADLAKSITQAPPKDQPLPRYYQPVCVKIFGLDADYAELVGQRINDNIRALKLPVGTKGCQPNSWVGFVSDSYDSVVRLRKEEPAMFAALNEYEIERILANSRAAQAWHALEAKGIDGKPFLYATIEIGGVEKTVRVNSQYQTGRLLPTTRVDMIGAIVLFDRKLSAGKTIRQLADYSTFRLLTPVKELSSEPGELQSILSLFADMVMPPAGLTEFDWSYLDAYYKLQRGSRVEKVQDAAKRAYLDGVGQKLSKRDEHDNQN